jgi:hypothetical protein
VFLNQAQRIIGEGNIFVSVVFAGGIARKGVVPIGVWFFVTRYSSRQRQQRSRGGGCRERCCNAGRISARLWRRYKGVISRIRRRVACGWASSGVDVAQL